VTEQGQLYRDIEQTRAELAAIVETLDVKPPARENQAEAQEQVKGRRAAPLAAIAVAVAAVWLVRRRTSD